MIAILIILLIVVPLSIFWVSCIDYMNKNHSDYKGLDLFDEEDKYEI
jgi:hypothetical protein